MMTTDSQKAPTGVTVGLSVAETSEMVALGVNAAEVTYMTEAIAQHLLSQGIGIASASETPCQARICIGGRIEGVNGHYPSIIENALTTLEAERPLYLSGVIGGAAEQVIAALRQAPMPTAFGRPRGAGKPAPKDMWNRLMSVGVAGLARHNGLSIAENEALFKATNISQISETVVLGLSRLRASNRL